jgi:hypothetical protein
MKKVFRILSLVGIMAIVACSGEPIKLNYVDFRTYLDDPDNGLKKKKSVGDMHVSLTFLPCELLAFQEMDKMTSSHTIELFDSLKQTYENQLTFKLSFSAGDEENDQNVINAGIQSYVDYSDRIKQLSFGIENDIKLVVDSAIYYPVLTKLEDTYELKKEKDIIVVFSPKENPDEFKTTSNFKLSYFDREFGMGLLKFKFSNKDIRNLPELIIENQN